MSTARIAWLESQMDSDDFDMSLFDSYSKELNELQTTVNEKREQHRLAKEKQRKEEQELIELSFIESLTEEQVDKMYEDTCLKYHDVNGMSFKKWYEKSLKYYTIDDKHNVHARARSPNTVEIVEHKTLAQAKLTILRRIKYKFNDHTLRGWDFAYDIED